MLFLSIGAVGKGKLDEGKGDSLGLQQWDRAIAILDVSRLRLDHQRPPVGVHHGMALTALDLLGRVITSRAAGLHGLDALTVDHRRRGTGLAPAPLAVAPNESVVGGHEQALTATMNGRTQGR